MEMKSINEAGKSVFLQAITKMKDGYLKLDNGSGFMPAIFEEIGFIDGYGKHYSVAHYGELNGDLMRDPDMTFVEKDGEFYPISFRNDYVGVDQEVFQYESGRVTQVNFELQHELAGFANLWFRNIREQQDLE